MKKYENSDYLLNKDSEDFIYDGCVIKYEDCLRENPNYTKEEFDKLKDSYNNMLLSELNSLNNINRAKENYKKEPTSNVFKSCENEDNIANDEEIIYNLIKLITSEQLTEKQIRRSILHFFEDLSYTEISKIEGVGYGRIKKSIEKVKAKLKTNY